jgi:cyclic dehypoxanthinyl futalosine synthase
MSDQIKTDAVTYLRTLAMARVICENVPNLQSSWVTMGHKVGQVALRFGANDYGSLMMEENVVSAAGTTHRTTVEEIERLISDAGYTPRRRRQDYSMLEDEVESRTTLPVPA